MIKVRPPHIISEQIRDLDKVIFSTEEMLVRYPDDYSLEIGIDQDRQMKKQLMAELDESLAVYRQHSLKFIFKTASKAVNLDILISGLRSFKELIDKSFEKECNSEINLRLESVFSGSFGILLTTPFDDSLVCGDYEKGLSSIFNTLKVLNTDNVNIHDVVKNNLKGDRKLLRKYVNFLDSVVNSENPIELKWTDHQREGRKVTISVDFARRLSNIFKEHEAIKPETLEIKGYVKGLSLLKNKVEFQRSDDKSKTIIKAKFDKILTSEVKDAFDLLALAKFKLQTELNEVTEEEIKRWELLKITVIR